MMHGEWYRIVYDCYIMIDDYDVLWFEDENFLIASVELW